MKRNMTKMLLLTLMLVASSNMWAYDFVVDNLRYNQKSANEVWVTTLSDNSRIRYEGELVVPDEVVYQGTTYKVTGVEEGAFALCDNLTSVTLGNNVKILGDNSFDRSRKLEKVVLGNSVEKIGNKAFYDCILITSIQLPETLIEIRESAFVGTSITSIVIPDKVTTLGSNIFNSCAKLEWVKIGKGGTTISDYMFNSCKALKSIVLPDNVKTIARASFAKTGIEIAYLGKGVTNIEGTAFSVCRSLKTVYSAATTPATVDEKTFTSTNIASINLVVPTGSKSAYQSASVWKDFGTITEMDNIETANIQQFNIQSNMQGIYDMTGRQLPAMQKGLNIVKMSNGKTRKVVVQ